jgi:uncharacterized protein YbjT (DUF2867 family)
VARALLAAGFRVRALTRNPAGAQASDLAELGAELARGDLLQADSLVVAMRGAVAVYAVTTPFGDGPNAEIEQGKQLMHAARDAEVPWLVLASVASADRARVPHFASKWQIEQELRASGLSHSVVAPTYFYENLADPPGLIEEGELALPLPASRPLQQVALADLGSVVASMLSRRQEFLGQRIEVAGDQPTPQQMAEALSQASGRPVRYRQLDLEVVAARSADLASMYSFLAQEGYQVDIEGIRARFPDVGWTSFGDWATERLRTR